MGKREAVRPPGALDPSAIPDGSDRADNTLTKKTFWDDAARRPFQTPVADIAFVQSLGVPLLSTYYARRLQENFRLMPWNGTLRQVTCGRCDKQTLTSWPEKYDGRILCEQCYLREVY